MNLLQEIDAAAANNRLDAERGDIAFTLGFVRGLEASMTAGSEQQSEGATKEAGSPADASSGGQSEVARSGKREKFYLSTAINYANGAPHMGHAYEAVTSDVICRFHRRFGRDVFFLTGSDEHGQKVADTAAKVNLTPKQSCDKWVAGFQNLNKQLCISNDAYIRTTDKKHYKLVQAMWERSLENGDIYLDNYEGWYNTREEKFVTETDATAANFEDGCGNKLVKMCEPGYMFRMSKYHARLQKHIEENPEFIQPESARKLILNRLQKDPLRDLAVSRSKLKWGVPVPNDPAHVMYVWFDALNNYLSGIDYLDAPDGSGRQLRDYWPAGVHIIGKDIVWFHTVIWPCILFSCGVPLPKAVFAHGFVNDKEGVKMSKSQGNVVDPIELLKTYPSDMVRYYLVREAVFGSDMPFNADALKSICDSDLADKLGNLVNRVCNLCKKYCGSAVPDVEVTTPFDVVAVRAAAATALAAYNLKALSELAINMIKQTNDFLTKAEPWKKTKTDAFRQQTVRAVLEAVYVAAHFLEPIVPSCCERIFTTFGSSPKTIPELGNSNNLRPGTAVVAKVILFPKEGAIGKAARAQQKAAGGKAGAKKGGKNKVKKKKNKGGGNNAKAGKNMTAPEKLVLCVGVITKVWEMEDSDKCYCEEIDIGAESPRLIASGLRSHYTLEEMQGRRVVVVANLKPKKVGPAFISHGMVLCGWDKARTRCEFVDPPEGAKVGERITYPAVTFTGEPPVKANAKVWKLVKPKLHTDGSCVCTYDGSPLTTSAGVCTTKSVADGNLE